jgi:hypothetical protein
VLRHKRLIVLLTGVVCLIAADTNAQLVTRGRDFVYDEARHITWLRDANLPLTKTFDVQGIEPDGAMTWHTANRFIAAMNAANFLGYSDWRLPKIQPIGDAYNVYPSYDGSTDYSVNITSPRSELAYMFTVNLGNYSAPGETTAALNDDRKNRFDESLFSNLGCASDRPWCPTFWSGNIYPRNSVYPMTGLGVWVFDMDVGWQSGDYAEKLYYVWPVRDGDVGNKATATVSLAGDKDNFGTGQPLGTQINNWVGVRPSRFAWILRYFAAIPRRFLRSRAFCLFAPGRIPLAWRPRGGGRRVRPSSHPARPADSMRQM